MVPHRTETTRFRLGDQRSHKEIRKHPSTPVSSPPSRLGLRCAKPLCLPVRTDLQTPKPVMVIVDARQREVIPTDAYFAVEEIKDVRYLLSPAPFPTPRCFADTPIYASTSNGQHRTGRRRKRPSCTYHR